MAAQSPVFPNSLKSNRSLAQCFGAAIHFVTSLFSAGDITEQNIVRTMGDLRGYIDGISERIGEVGREWEVVRQQLSRLKEELNSPSIAVRSTAAAHAWIHHKRHEGFQAAIDALVKNATSAELLIQKLSGLRILTAGPMTQEDIDNWASQLQVAVETDAGIERALSELDAASVRSMPEEDVVAPLPALGEQPAELPEPPRAPALEPPVEEVEPVQVKKMRRLLAEF